MAEGTGSRGRRTARIVSGLVLVAVAVVLAALDLPSEPFFGRWLQVAVFALGGLSIYEAFRRRGSRADGG